MPIFRLPPFTVETVLLPSDIGKVIDRSLTQYGIPEAWAETKGEGVTVAVLDTGWDVGHPDLAIGVMGAKDFTGSFFGERDRAGHGTHCAGTIGARGRVNGVAPACSLLIGKVLGDDGSGRDNGIAAGIAWACAMGADVISMSLGSPAPSPAMQAEMQKAVATHGVFIICAAGNDGYRPGQNTVNYPARYNTLCLPTAAVDENGRVAEFSSRGPEVAIAAPGVNILSTYLGHSYARLSGTSMATPFVAGVVALCVAKHRKSPGKTPLNTLAELEKHLAATATDAGIPGRDNDYGYGLIAPGKILDSLTPPADPTPPPTVPGPGTIHVIGPWFGPKGEQGEMVWRPLR